MKTKTRRMHSEDARLLRSMLLDVITRQVELETAIGHLQHIVTPGLSIEIPEPDTEIIESLGGE